MSAAHADRLAAARADVERAQREHADAVAAADAVRPDAARCPLPACISSLPASHTARRPAILVHRDPMSMQSG